MLNRFCTYEFQFKIGRSVARSKPTDNNAIFDCKVLSRNHALIWYKEGKFFLQDTKSSNGTFVNSQKIESQKYVQLLEKDVLKFGFSSREYVMLHDQSKEQEEEDPGVE